jgi:predicted DNA-binding transcriptional regulator AlpA
MHDGSDSVHDDRLLTIEEVTARFAIRPALLAQLRRVGGGPRFVRLGRRTIRYRAEDVRAWLAQEARSGAGD